MNTYLHCIATFGLLVGPMIASAQATLAASSRFISHSSAPIERLQLQTPYKAAMEDLKKAGYFDRSLPKPYRLAIPLVQFNDSGLALKATYTKLPGETAGKGFLIFVTMPLD